MLKGYLIVEKSALPDYFEKVVQARAQKAFERGGTVLACTRYGNVVGSRGSVVPVFLQQRKTGKITVTLYISFSCSSFKASGFSQRTCLPALRDLITHSR